MSFLFFFLSDSFICVFIYSPRCVLLWVLFLLFSSFSTHCSLSCFPCTSFSLSLLLSSLMLFFHLTAWFCLWLSTLLPPPPVPPEPPEKSTPSVSHLSLMISHWIYSIYGSRKKSLWPFGNADKHARASFMHQNEAILLPLPLNQVLAFISVCLLAGCCLSVAACGTLAAFHSWSFVLCGVFIMGVGFSHCPSRHLSQGLGFSQLNPPSLLPPSLPIFPFHFSTIS